ncbi:MAG: dethiobiotin synthase [Phenylobacterium sp.]
MKRVFIAGAHTDVGKTFVACGLLRAAREAGLSVEALKPVASGFDPGDWNDSDPGRLLQALGRPLSETELDAMTPWRFTAPLAPPMAARLEGRSLGLPEIAEFCQARAAESRAGLLVVEGVGGVMSPIAEQVTALQLMSALHYPVVLVGGSYLGAISHTLTALEVLRSRGLTIVGLVISQSRGPGAPDFAETVCEVRAFAGGRRVLSAPLDDVADWPQHLLDALG